MYLDKYERLGLKNGQKLKAEHLKHIEDGIINTLTVFNATEYGVSTENNGLTNSKNLQVLIDGLSVIGGGTVYIPSGTYRFASNEKTKSGETCIMLRSNVNIKGDGFTTILKPTGNKPNGLDMFHYMDVSYSGSAKYLENCIFEDFTINGEDACLTGQYSAMGKGFMISPMKNCHFRRLNIQNTDGTGLGVDCPVNCSAIDVVTYNCGKAGTTDSTGASGIGVGFGYSLDECMYISRCKCLSNKVFGIFFEHQKRFDENAYQSATNKGFIVDNCICFDNHYNFGGHVADSVLYRDCISKNARTHGYIFINSTNCSCEGCYSEGEGNTSFVVLAQHDTWSGKSLQSYDISYLNCVSKDSLYGVKIVNQYSDAYAKANRTLIKGCYFNRCKTNVITTNGLFEDLYLQGNFANVGSNNFGATVNKFVNIGNSWNE